MDGSSGGEGKRMTVSNVYLRAPKTAIVEVEMGECQVSETRDCRLDLLQRRSESPDY